MKTMTNSLSSRAGAMLRWQFRMNNRLLTCGVNQAGASGFSVITLPHWDVRSSTVEMFPSQSSALQRHATIAERLRSAGWAVESYTR